MFPPGFLGTRADILVDIVTLSFAVILPALVWSWLLVRRHKNYRWHRNTQVSLAIVLAVVVGLFEYNLAASGGIFEITRGGRYEGTSVLHTTIWVHTAFAVLASITWIALIALSLWRFPSPPRPAPFSRAHRAWGRVAMASMAGAAVTALPLYYFGFVA